MRKGHHGSAPAATRRRGQHMTTTALRSAQAAFLVALRDTGSVHAACRVTALGKSSVYRWAASDRGFAAQLGIHPARHETPLAPERPSRVLPARIPARVAAPWAADDAHRRGGSTARTVAPPAGVPGAAGLTAAAKGTPPKRRPVRQPNARARPPIPTPDNSDTSTRAMRARRQRGVVLTRRSTLSAG
jgi:hypothetical protein